MTAFRRCLLPAVMASLSLSCGNDLRTPATPSAAPAAPQRSIELKLSATPEHLTTTRSSRITAVVLDGAGQPVRDAPVIFRVAEPAASSDRMDAGGHPVFTDASGRAEDIFRTGARADAGPLRAKLGVQVLQDRETLVEISIN